MSRLPSVPLPVRSQAYMCRVLDLLFSGSIGRGDSEQAGVGRVRGSRVEFSKLHDNDGMVNDWQ